MFRIIWVPARPTHVLLRRIVELGEPPASRTGLVCIFGAYSNELPHKDVPVHCLKTRSVTGVQVIPYLALQVFVNDPTVDVIDKHMAKEPEHAPHIRMAVVKRSLKLRKCVPVPDLEKSSALRHESASGPLHLVFNRV